MRVMLSGFVLLMAAGTTNAVAVTPPTAPIPLACTVSGAGAISGETAASVCARVRKAVDRSLATRTVAAKALPAAGAAIAVTVRIDKRSLSARVVQRRGKTLHTHPEIAVDVMDRSTRPADIDQLAAAIAQAVASR